jgi:phage host-nuclease inhibitor protein Gam
MKFLVFTSGEKISFLISNVALNNGDFKWVFLASTALIGLVIKYFINLYNARIADLKSQIKSVIEEVQSLKGQLKEEIQYNKDQDNKNIKLLADVEVAMFRNSSLLNSLSGQLLETYGPKILESKAILEELKKKLEDGFPRST